MINLLRKIRRNTMTENKPDLYLVYAIGEVVLVVIGILIALQIDNWNENQRIRYIEQQYLLALKEEFNYNKIELARVMNLNTKYTDYALKFALSSWGAVFNKALWQERTHETLRVQIVEMARVHGNIRSITFKWGEPLNIKPTKFKRGNLQLLKSEELDNRVVAFILTARSLNENAYANVGEEIDRILRLIETEIDQ